LRLLVIDHWFDAERFGDRRWILAGRQAARGFGALSRRLYRDLHHRPLLGR
jgi:hypothetical protein